MKQNVTYTMIIIAIAAMWLIAGYEIGRHSAPVYNISGGFVNTK